MKHIARIVLFTLSLYIMTHIVAFSMLPFALILSALGRMSELQRLKVRFAKTETHYAQAAQRIWSI